MDPRIALLVAASLALSACSVRYDVRTDFDPEADFARFHSYAFAPRPKQDTPDILDNSLVRKRLDALFARHLTARGLRAAADPAAADLTVRYWIAARERTDVSSIPSAAPFLGPYPYRGPYPFWGARWAPMYDDVIVQHYTEGTLVLDLVDAKSESLVWRAYVVGRISTDQDAAYAALDEALERAFAVFPPQAAAAR